jgi:purine-cytosine permease-like protein
MGLPDAALTILFFNALCCLPVALFSTWGMQTGLRQMVHCQHHCWCICIESRQ